MTLANRVVFTASKRRFAIIATTLLIVTLVLSTAFYLKSKASEQRSAIEYNVHQAKNDFALGLMHIALSGGRDTPWQRSIGIALLRQSLEAYVDATQLLEEEIPGADLAAATSALQASLQQLYEAPQAEISAQVFVLNKQTDLLESQLNGAIERQRVRLARWFTFTILTCNLFLLTMLGMALTRSESNRRSLRSSLKLNEQRFLPLLHNAEEVFWLEESETAQLLYVSPAFEKVTGISVTQVLNEKAACHLFIHPDDKDKVERLRRNAARESQDIECRVIRPDGSIRWIAGRIFPIWTNGEGRNREKPDYTAAIVRDVTEKRALRQKLFQVQKMDSLGQLTGGIAHDFNNLLTVILINTENLIPRLSEHPELARMMELITRAAKRGASLNQQLLAFASKQQLQPKVVLIQDLVAESVELLQRTLGEKFTLEFQQNASNIWVKVDPGQLQNALVNLCINSRDAMPQGGKISLRLNKSAVGDLYGVPGETVHLAVKDNGCGIPADILDRVLEPFYTTKPADKGTGLGLSMVFGFVRQSGGSMYIASKQHKGTTVHMVLPICQPGQQKLAKQLVTERVDSHLILLVEDDALVRESTAYVLQNAGLRVIEAEDAQDALSILRVKKDVELVITDVVMPGTLTGFDLAEQIATHYPQIQIVVMSGYVGNNNQHSPRWQFLQKPFSNEKLLQRVQESLADGA